MPRIENNLTEGSVLKKLIVFALPFLASNIIQSFYNVADMLIVGNFSGAESMSGVNIGGQITFILTNIIIGLCVGATVLIGQYIGRGKKDALKSVTATIITMLLILSVSISVVMLIFRVPILHLIQTPPESFEESKRYLTVTVSGLVFIFGYNAFAAILQGMGDSKHPFYFVLASCITNVILDFLLVGFFGLGALGAALATVASQALSVVLCISYMVRNNFQFDFRRKSFRIDKEQLKLILKIGLPTSVQNGVTSLSFLFITMMVNTFGVYASAAVGAAGKFNSFAFMPAIAISASIASMSAQNIGAGKMDRAVSACRIGTVFAVVIMYTFFFFVQMFPDEILRIFADDERMIESGVTYVRTFSFDLLFVPFIFCINGFLNGGGHTFFSLMNGMLSSLLLRVPMAYILGVKFNMGLFGVGLGAPAASSGALIIVIIYLLSGKWKVNKIAHAD
ncbi:MAG: MATE family efflux transporter [Clostridiales bacterium]|nr:MATE family efflux transporter [Clostridiales bacterium]